MFRELSAALDLKSPRDDVSLFSPARSQPFHLSFLSLLYSVSLFLRLLRYLSCPYSSLFLYNHLVLLCLPSQPIRTLKSFTRPENFPVLDSWGISGWIRKLIKDDLLYGTNQMFKLFFIIDCYYVSISKLLYILTI